MAIFGAFGSFGHYLLIAAHRLAPASVLAPFMYTQLVWATCFGYLIFGDVPNSWTLAGAAIVVASGLYLLHRERVTGTRPDSRADLMFFRTARALLWSRPISKGPQGNRFKDNNAGQSPDPNRQKPGLNDDIGEDIAARIVPLAGAAARSRAARL